MNYLFKLNLIMFLTLCSSISYATDTLQEGRESNKNKICRSLSEPENTPQNIIREQSNVSRKRACFERSSSDQAVKNYYISQQNNKITKAQGVKIPKLDLNVIEQNPGEEKVDNDTKKHKKVLNSRRTRSLGRGGQKPTKKFNEADASKSSGIKMPTISPRKILNLNSIKRSLTHKNGNSVKEQHDRENPDRVNTAEIIEGTREVLTQLRMVQMTENQDDKESLRRKNKEVGGIVKKKISDDNARELQDRISSTLDSAKKEVDHIAKKHRGLL